MLEISGLKKRFGATTALSGVDLSIKAGEIVGVAGPNGAGKSTLVHILAGEIPEDSGDVMLDDEPLPFSERAAKVSVVHQELQLFPTLTVLENLLVGSDGSRVFRPRPSAEVRAVAAEFGLLGVADRPLDSCSLVVQQLTEIARAMLHQKRIILLDEPNSALTPSESDRLFGEVLRLREQGRTLVLLVSHRLPDLERYGDRVVVIREGVVTTELAGPELTTRGLAEAIVGGATVERAWRVAAAPHGAVGDGAVEPAMAARVAADSQSQPRSTLLNAGAGQSMTVVDVRGWTDALAGAFADINLAVHAGEAVFITGQEDGGGRELLRAVAGLRRARGEAVRLPLAATGDACYVPGSRKSSLFSNLSVRANLCVRLGGNLLGIGGVLLRHDLMNERARTYVERLEILAPSIGAPIGVLSGGTQQKVAIGSALAAEPRILILEDPTRGVDVKTRDQIVRSLRDFLEAGNAILGFSPELEEVFEIADSVRVAVRGRLSEPLTITPELTLDGLARWVDFMNSQGNENLGQLDRETRDADREEQMSRTRSEVPRLESGDEAGQHL